MPLSACLTCHNARKEGDLAIGQARCRLDGEAYNLMHVCFSFDHVLRNRFLAVPAAASGGGFRVAVVSTTATNSPSGAKEGAF